VGENEGGGVKGGEVWAGGGGVKIEGEGGGGRGVGGGGGGGGGGGASLVGIWQIGWWKGRGYVRQAGYKAACVANSPRYIS